MKKNNVGLIGITLLIIFLIVTIRIVPLEKVIDITKTISADDKGLFRLTKKNVKRWGLGTELQEYVSLDRDYDWYIDQHNTGKYGKSNCSVTCVVMTKKWCYKDYKKTTEEARAAVVSLREAHDKVYGHNKYGTYRNYFNNNLIENGIKVSEEYNKNVTEEKLINNIKEGKIIISSLRNSAFSGNENSIERVHKYGVKGGGVLGNHSIILKGYAKVDDKLYFEVYDPYNCRMKYSDGTPMYMNRYYLAEQVVKGMTGKLKNSTFLIIEGGSQENSL